MSKCFCLCLLSVYTHTSMEEEERTCLLVCVWVDGLLYLCLSSFLHNSSVSSSNHIHTFTYTHTHTLTGCPAGTLVYASVKGKSRVLRMTFSGGSTQSKVGGAGAAKVGFTALMTAAALGKGWEDAVAAKKPNAASVVVRMVEMLCVCRVGRGCVCVDVCVCVAVCRERERRR